MRVWAQAVLGSLFRLNRVFTLMTALCFMGFASASTRTQAQIHENLQQAEAVCYQRFAVEDCLQAERRNARQALVAVHQNEAALDAQMRRERANQRLQAIDERLQSHTPVSVVPPRHPLQPAKVRAVAPMAAAVQAHQKAALREASTRALQASAARERQIQKQGAAQAHKAQVEERIKASTKTSGRPPAMPLPVPPL